MKWVYSLARLALIGWVPEGERPRFPPITAEPTQSLFVYGSRVFDMLASAVGGRLSDAANWLYNGFKDAAQWAAAGVTNLSAFIANRASSIISWLTTAINNAATWVVQNVVLPAFNLVTPLWDAVNWLYDRVRDASQWAAAGVTNLTQFIWNRANYVIQRLAESIYNAAAWVVQNVVLPAVNVVTPIWDAARWLWTNLTDAVAGIPGMVGGAVIAGGQAIGDLIFDAFRWLVNEAAAPLVGPVNRKLAIPNKLITGQYGSVQALIDDMLDPPDEILKGWTGLLTLPFVVVGLQNAQVVPVRIAADGTPTRNGPAVPFGDALDGIASGTISPDGKQLYVASLLPRQLLVFDIAADGSVSPVKQRVSTGLNPIYPRVTPDGRHVYIVNEISGSVSGFARAEDGSPTTQASMTSPRLCGGILVAMPTAMPPAPLTRRFGNLAGKTDGSVSLLS